MPRIAVTSVLVNDQARALEFYTEKLGFVVKNDISLGEYRWLTVVGAEEPDGVELLLEPAAHPAAAVFTTALFDDGVPFTSFQVADVAETHADLLARGVRFTQEPTAMGPVVTAVLDDTCGNLIQLTSPARGE